MGCYVLGVCGPAAPALPLIEQTVLSIDNPAGPKAYNVSKDADVTVVLYVDRKVKANHAFKKGELTDKDIEKFVSEVPMIVNDQK